MSYIPDIFDGVKSLRDAGNWALVEEIEVSGTVDELIENLDGDVDEKYMIDFQLTAEAVSTSSDAYVALYLNNDTDNSHYKSDVLWEHYNGSSSSSGGTALTAPILMFLGDSATAAVSGHVCIYTKSGRIREFIGSFRDQVTDFSKQWIYNQAASWNNTVDNVTSIRLLSDNLHNITGIIKVYKWQDVSLSTTFRWELIKEVKRGETLPTFDMDVKKYDRYRIEFSADRDFSAGYDFYFMRVNGDSSSNYQMDGRYDGGAAGAINDVRTLFNISWNNGLALLELDIFNKVLFGNWKSILKDGTYDIHTHVKAASHYLGSADITQLNFIAAVSTTKASLKIYKLVNVIPLHPYKKLVAEAYKIAEIDGISIDVNQNKKYEVELSVAGAQPTGTGKILFNSDTGTNYYLTRNYIPSDGSNHPSYRANEAQADLLVYDWGSSGNFMGKWTLYPKARQMSHNRNSVADWNNGWTDYGSQINTLDFTAPSDNIDCVFKVWEITE